MILCLFGSILVQAGAPTLPVYEHVYGHGCHVVRADKGLEFYPISYDRTLIRPDLKDAERMRIIAAHTVLIDGKQKLFDVTTEMFKSTDPEAYEGGRYAQRLMSWNLEGQVSLNSDTMYNLSKVRNEAINYRIINRVVDRLKRSGFESR